MTRVSLLSAIAFAIVVSAAAPASAQIGQILNGANAITVPVVSTGTTRCSMGPSPCNGSSPHRPASRQWVC